VLPLMRRVRCLDKMVPNAPLEGTVLVTRGLDREEIKRRLGLSLPMSSSTSTRQCALMMISLRW
jgi:hypothetical protein